MGSRAGQGASVLVNVLPRAATASPRGPYQQSDERLSGWSYQATNLSNREQRLNGRRRVPLHPSQERRTGRRVDGGHTLQLARIVQQAS